jgi:hypothetical protein
MTTLTNLTGTVALRGRRPRHPPKRGARLLGALENHHNRASEGLLRSFWASSGAADRLMQQCQFISYLSGEDAQYLRRSMGKFLHARVDRRGHPEASSLNSPWTSTLVPLRYFNATRILSPMWSTHASRIIDLSGFVDALSETD